MVMSPRLNTVNIEVIYKGKTTLLSFPLATLPEMTNSLVVIPDYLLYPEKIQLRLLRNLSDMIKHHSPYLKDNDTDGSFITVTCVYKR